MLAKFVEKLKATPDGDGSLLDHSLVFYGSGMGNSNVHATDPLPMLALGGGGGKGDRHIVLAKKTEIGNLWLTVANQFGRRSIGSARARARWSSSDMIAPRDRVVFGGGVRCSRARRQRWPPGPTRR